MSRTFWVAVGAIGGIYAYRRGQRAVDNAKERGLVGNVQYAAETAQSVSGGVARLLALATPTPTNAVIVDYDSMAELPRDVQVTPVRRTELGRRHPEMPATAMRFEALDKSTVIDVREARRLRRAQRVS